MKVTAIIAAAVIGLASAAPVAEPQEAASKPSVGGQTYFRAVASDSGTPIHLQNLHAADGKIWIGKKTEKFCPDSAKKAGKCPGGSGTAFLSVNPSPGTLYMGVSVPNGQQVYIDQSTGALAYTPGGDPNVPNGAITNGWTFNPDIGNGAGLLKWRRGLVACSTTQVEGQYQIFANLKSVQFSPGCVGPFAAVTSNVTSPQAWQYE
ncbi:hypothetical protein BDY17DRAFT_319640 [Neohortaea acidophila]|uniref:Cell wall protein PhiA n=1 Tax=Neohortaea acidophila TaxID=245834 RepID=A0A6A6Q465_9PEZI|nr:uncharacterized protein BDY17DRAFT_319640 [Neohortaea acidophila]KAF2487072.1 hypothetical protein BDY17DRAFT_319640 [Neohortaea acidophila]